MIIPVAESEPTAENAGRLGRHIEYDRRNEEHRLRSLAAPKPTGALKPKMWSRRLPPMDQGNLGACTAYSTVGVCRTKPVTGGLSNKSRRLLGDPESIYTRITTADNYPGQWPPEDTGSSVLAAMQTMKALGIIQSYKWGYDPTEAATGLATLASGVLGTWWMEGMDRPDDKGLVRPTGARRGGHAYQAIGRIWDTDEWIWIFVQSWGPTWPARPALGRPAHFAMTEADVFHLIEDEGEFAVPLLVA